MFNKVVMVGHLTRDVELKYFPMGNGCVATLGLAVNRKYKKQDGSQGEEACFIDCKLFGRTAEIANQYLKKGSKILVEGRLAQEHWESNGQKKSKHIIQGESIQMLYSKPQGQEHTQQVQGQYPQAQQYANAYENAQGVDLRHQYKQLNIPEMIIEDEIPF